MRVRPLFLLFAGLAACAPTYQPTPPNPAQPAEREAREREENARAWVTFYETYPVLKGREKCVARALNTLSDKTWENLAQASISFCVAPPPPVNDSRAWLKVATGTDGHSTFVDLSRIEVRKDNQLTFWQLTERFDDDADFQLARVVADCDRKLCALVQVADIVAGSYGQSASYGPPPDWHSALPNSKGEAILGSACAARAALMKPAAPARPHSPVTNSPAKSTPEI